MAWKIFKKSKYFGGFFLKFFKIHKYRQSPSKKKNGAEKKVKDDDDDARKEDT